jgi:hypothetical protein
MKIPNRAKLIRELVEKITAYERTIIIKAAARPSVGRGCPVIHIGGRKRQRCRADSSSRLHAARCRNQIGSARISAAEPQFEM